MKILIIEDSVFYARCISRTLESLGEITFAIRESLELLEEYGVANCGMLPMQEVVQLIMEADLVLLDQDLSDEFTGKDLIPFCEGKKLVGISSNTQLGTVNWNRKEYLDRPEIAEDLRLLVKKTIEE